jgi:hypothetical protein
MVYQQLLTACFREGFILEQKYSWLPQIRTNMMARMKGRGVMPRVVWFYVAGSVVGLSISGIGSAFWAQKYGFQGIAAVVVVYCILAGGLVWYMVSAGGRKPDD